MPRGIGSRFEKGDIIVMSAAGYNNMPSRGLDEMY